MKVGDRATSRHQFVTRGPQGLVEIHLKHRQQVFELLQCTRTNYRRGNPWLILDPHYRQLGWRDAERLGQSYEFTTDSDGASGDAIRVYATAQIRTRIGWKTRAV